MENSIGLFITGLASIVSIIISIVVLLKFFSLCSDIKFISKNINDFTKYYYKMQEFKNSNNTQN